MKLASLVAFYFPIGTTTPNCLRLQKVMRMVKGTKSRRTQKGGAGLKPPAQKKTARGSTGIRLGDLQTDRRQQTVDRPSEGAVHKRSAIAAGILDDDWKDVVALDRRYTRLVRALSKAGPKNAVQRLSDALSRLYEDSQRHSTDGFAAATIGVSHAERLSGRYGMILTESRGFLAAYADTLSWVGGTQWNSATSQVAELLSRPLLRADWRLPLVDYDTLHRIITTEYAQAQLETLQADHARTANPVIPWLAWDLARSYDMTVPNWVMESFDRSASNIASLIEERRQGSSAGRDAEAVGKALGFGKGKPGRGGALETIALLNRNRQLHAALRAWLANENRRPFGAPKITLGYAEIAQAFDTDPNTVSRAFHAVEKLLADVRALPGEPDEAADE